MTELAFEIRFIGSDLPDGIMDAANLARICTSLQELANRVGRWAFDTAGLGRSPKASEVITRVNVTGLTKGSTRLRISTGPARGQSAATSHLADQTNELLWGVVHGSGTGALPEDAPVKVRRTTLDFLKALNGSAPNVEFRAISPGFDPAPVEFAPMEAATRSWFDAEPITTPEVPQTVSGTLEMVNLRTRRFRIRDSVNTTFELVNVPDTQRAAQLVGQLVTATGSSTRAHPRVIATLDLRPVEIPNWAAESAKQEARFWQSLAKAKTYDPSNCPAFELDKDEWDAFWDAVHGA